MHSASHTFKLWWEPPNQNQGVYFTLLRSWLFLRCGISEYENFTIVSPSHTEGHTITKCLSSRPQPGAFNRLILSFYAIFSRLKDIPKMLKRECCSIRVGGWIKKNNLKVMVRRRSKEYDIKHDIMLNMTLSDFLLPPCDHPDKCSLAFLLFLQ